MNRSELLVGVALAALFAVVGVALIVTGAVLHQRRAALTQHGTRTEGTITGFKRVGAGPEDQLADKVLVPVVTFTTPAGQTVSFRGTMSEPIWSDYQKWRDGRCGV